MRRATTWLAMGLWLLWLGGVGTVIGMGAAGYHNPGFDLTALVGFGMFATVGLVIAIRRPRVPLGWVYLAIGVLTGVMSGADGYLAWAVRVHSAQGPVFVAAVSVETWVWYPLIGSTLTLTLLLFPEGLPSPRWRPVLWSTVSLLAVVTLMAALQPSLTYGRLHLANPIGIPDWRETDVTTTPLFGSLTVAFAILVAAAITSLVLRFRRARGVERQQIKWFVPTASLGAMVLIIAVLWQDFGTSPLGNALFDLLLAAIPVSCGLAILRYRLYDIDRIVSRTVTYALVTAALFGVYVGCVALFTRVLPFNGDVGTAASVLVAVALFAPLRHRVQHRVDRRFNRARYDAEATVAAFAGRLQDQVDLDAVRADLLGVVQTTVAPEHASLWLRETATP